MGSKASSNAFTLRGIVLMSYLDHYMSYSMKYIVET